MNNLFVNKPGNTMVVMIMAPIGSFYENSQYKGISHFMEHLAFKGTTKRTPKEISAAIDNVGGDLNAFTSEDMTCFWAKVSNRYKDLAIEIITDLASNSTIPENEVEKEREVIIQEMKMYEDDPKYAVEDLFNKTQYTQDSGYYESTIGTIETLKNIKQKELLNFKAENYKNDNLTKIVVGDISSQYDLNIQLPEDKDRMLLQAPNQKFEYRKNITQSNIVMGYCLQMKQYNPIEKVYMLRLLEALYSDMSGRLFTTIREKNNLVYRIHFYWDVLRDGSIVWKVKLGLDKDKIEKAINLIVEELSKPIVGEMEYLITKALGVVEMNQDSNYYLATELASRLSVGGSFKDILDADKSKYFNFSKEQINQFIKEMNFNNFCLSGILPQ